MYIQTQLYFIVAIHTIETTQEYRDHACLS